MSAPLHVGIAGLGTVGAEVVKVLSDNADVITARAGRPITVTAVSARDHSRDRGVSLDGLSWFDDAMDLAAADNVDVVVELIGGSDGIAKNLVETALTGSKHVVTANKALVAHHGLDLATSAENANVSLAYEAAVAGGIPIIKSLRDGLSANIIGGVHGILNGTCNYILTNMTESGHPFDDVLVEATELGYAELDPTFDVGGIDAAHKLAILASVAFGTQIDFGSVYIEGIEHVSPVDIHFAKKLGYGIKLLGVAKRREDGIEQRVHPCMVPVDSPINHVSGVYNGVVVDGDTVDTTLYEGRGAGAGPTASAVIADIIDIARGIEVPTFGVRVKDLKPSNTVSMSDHVGPYYLRLMVVDEPGVFADIAACLKNNDVSMGSILQPSRDPGEPVPVVMTIHETQERAMVSALTDMSALDSVVEKPIMIRIENVSN
jgi:homoserine dehydrogenase